MTLRTNASCLDIWAGLGCLRTRDALEHRPHPFDRGDERL